jgi:hypothetical protein
VKYLLIFLLLSLQIPIEIGGKATLEKILWSDGKIIEENNYSQPTYYSISEIDSSLIVGVVKYGIKSIISINNSTIYKVNETPYKEFVYINKDRSLTQKNIKWLATHGLETWYIYTLIESSNQFELGN